ncbi:DUF1648 domain-containing protein [Streptomyces albus subsp. chlorinus]|nr:DUF1648 domain-containing protein [Streptomyces albus subsp. chlorinus]
MDTCGNRTCGNHTCGNDTCGQGDGNGGRGPRGTAFPWVWLVPGLLTLAGLVAWGIVVYPRLPPQVPQHFGSDGVDAYADKSVGSVFLPVLVHAGALALVAGTAYATLRVTPASELGPGRRAFGLVNRPSTREGARRIAKAQLFLGFCLGLTMAGSCKLMWDTAPHRRGAATAGPLVLVLAPLAVGTLAVLGAALWDRRSVPAAKTKKATGTETGGGPHRPPSAG